MTSKRVLVAVRPEDDNLVSAVLDGHFDFTIRHRLAEAVEGLDESFGLIVCGVHFDQGAMFDLLATAKAHPAASLVPFFLVLREETHHSPSVITGIRSAATVRGADAFIDMRDLKTQMDEQQMLVHLRNIVRDVFLSQN
ncbi:hypothetical protein [Noviherbaspirillum aerium]|uniref:hypothetical protein n=1 Tax=Noviherbaspirillum aerium TaxID=2588497 RepID=UPI00124F08CF|nr:hypothetical protein [Noviherbaspirillum aerium]